MQLLLTSHRPHRRTFAGVGLPDEGGCAVDGVGGMDAMGSPAKDWEEPPPQPARKKFVTTSHSAIERTRNAGE